MNLGEKLLALSAEYQQAKDTITYANAYGCEPACRPLSEIGDEYADTLKQLLQQPA